MVTINPLWLSEVPENKLGDAVRLVCPEHLQCPVQCLIHVELSRAPRGHGELLSKKCCRPLTGASPAPTLHCTERYKELKWGDHHVTHYQVYQRGRTGSPRVY